LCVFPSGEVQVYLWMLRWGNMVLLTTKFLDVVKFTTLTPQAVRAYETSVYFNESTWRYNQEVCLKYTRLIAP
jgi:hypothetical protein